MHHSHRLLALFPLCCALLGGCSPRQGDMVVLEVGAKTVTMNEYEHFFVRNTGGWNMASKSTQEERERFLDLLTNYKLKLLDAYDRGLDKDTEIVDELSEYRHSLASTFLIERELTEPGIREMYDRRKEEIRAQHILFSVKPDAPPAETLAAYSKALEVIARAGKGEHFDSLALRFSEDPSVKSNRGDLYYFTSGHMVTPFENAAYALRKGEVSPQPIRTAFGYHVLKILDRQPARGTIKVRHMMARFQVSAKDSADTTNALIRIRGMRDSLLKGSDFAGLATKLSEDPGSAPQGGSLGWFERRRWVQPFDEAAFLLGPGQTSPIVRTPYGYHIIFCDSLKPFPSFDEMKEELKKQYQQFRYNDAYGNFLNGLKKQYRFTFDTTVFEGILPFLDSLQSVEDSAWDASIPSSVRRQSLMTIDGRPIPVDSVIRILMKRQEYGSTMLRRNEFRASVDRIAESLLIDRRTVNLEATYPEFANLMKEYQDGIVLYKAEQGEVWNNVAVTDSGIRTYFDKNRHLFMFPERVDIGEIYLESDTLAAILYDSLLKGADFSELASQYNDDPDLKESRGERGLLPDTTDDLAKLAAGLQVGTFSEPMEMETGGFAIVRLNRREPAREKTFEEAGAEVSNGFQEFETKRLEKLWLDRIALRHPVKQYREVLRNAFTETQSF